MPTAIDQGFLDMRVSDVRRIAHSGQDHHVVVLQESESGRRLPIWIGREQALELALRLLGHGSQLPRPLSSDLAARLVQALGGSLREVRIDRLSEGTYYAVIVVDGPQGTTEVDARPSDALALALVVGAPVRADRAVVETTESDDFIRAEAQRVFSLVRRRREDDDVRAECFRELHSHVPEATETDQTAAEGLAAIDSQAAVGAQALLDEITQANERQAPPEPAGP